MAAKAQCSLQAVEKVIYEYVSAPLTFGKPSSSAEEPDLGQDEAGPSGLGLGVESATRGGLGSVGGIGWALHLLTFATAVWLALNAASCIVLPPVPDAGDFACCWG